MYYKNGIFKLQDTIQKELNILMCQYVNIISHLTKCTYNKISTIYHIEDTGLLLYYNFIILDLS